MQQDEVERWLNTTSSVLKRRLEDRAVNNASEGEGPLKRSRVGQGFLKYFADPVRSRRSKSDGDIACTRKPPIRVDLELLSTNHYQNNAEAGAHMANVPLSPGTSASAMPPPSRPSSRASSRRRSQTSGRESITTSSSTYRSIILRRNHIFIQHTDIPQDVSRAVDDVLKGRENASALSDNEVQCVANTAFLTESGNEEDVIKGLSPVIFPNQVPATRNLARDDKSAFNTGATPHFPPPEIFSFTQPAVSNPVPDMLYGYPVGAFSTEQEMVQIEIDQQGECVLSATTKNLYWAFFIVEFKSQATGGTIWAATNQCAGAGSACTNALYRMFKAARGGQHSVRPDTICFSVAIDGQTASLHVHWHDDAADGFYCSRVRHYLLFTASGVRNLKCDVDSIINWGLDTRLPAIKSALDLFIARARGGAV